MSFIVILELNIEFALKVLNAYGSPVSYSLRDSSNESGATDAVGLSMSMSEMEDPEAKGKKKRGRPGKQLPVRVS